MAPLLHWTFKLLQVVVMSYYTHLTALLVVGCRHEQRQCSGRWSALVALRHWWPASSSDGEQSNVSWEIRRLNWTLHLPLFPPFPPFLLSWSFSQLLSRYVLSPYIPSLFHLPLLHSSPHENHCQQNEHHGYKQDDHKEGTQSNSRNISSLRGSSGWRRGGWGRRGRRGT